MLQLLATMLFSGGLLFACLVIGRALAADADAIRRALGLAVAPVVTPPLPPRYRVAAPRRMQRIQAGAVTGWREAA